MSAASIAFTDMEQRPTRHAGRGGVGAVMGAKGAVEVLYAREAQKTDDPQAFLAKKEKEYAEAVVNPFVAAKRGYIDDIIEPARTRFRIVKALQLIKDKRDTNPMKKHGNIPL